MTRSTASQPADNAPRARAASPRGSGTALGALRAMPWTLTTLTIVLIFNAVEGTLRAKPTEALLQRFGLGLDTLGDGKFWTLFSAIYMLDHPKAVLSTLAVIALYVGVYENLAGTWAAIAAWFLGTWATVTFAPLLWLPFAWLGWARPVTQVATAEFGSSASTWCCLGAAAGLPWAWRGWRRWAGLAGVALLLGRFAAYRSYTDVEHIAAFGFGVFAIAVWARPSARPPRPRVDVDRWQMARLGVALAGLLVAVTGLLVGTLDARDALAALLVALGMTLLAAALVTPRRADPLVLALLVVAGMLAISQIPNVATIGVVVGAGLLLLAAWRSSGG